MLQMYKNFRYLHIYWYYKYMGILDYYDLSFNAEQIDS